MLTTLFKRSREFRDVRDAAGAIGLARNLHNDVDGRRDLARRIACGGSRTSPIIAMVSRRARASARCVAVNGGDGEPSVTGVHGLQHVQRLFAANFAEHDPVGAANAQRIDDQFTLLDGACAFNVRRARLQPDDMLLPKLQLGRIFDRDDALVRADEP